MGMSSIAAPIVLRARRPAVAVAAISVVGSTSRVLGRAEGRGRAECPAGRRDGVGGAGGLARSCAVTVPERRFRARAEAERGRRVVTVDFELVGPLPGRRRPGAAHRRAGDRPAARRAARRRRRGRAAHRRRSSPATRAARSAGSTRPWPGPPSCARERRAHARARRSTRSSPPPRCGAARSRCPATSRTRRRRGRRLVRQGARASTGPATRCGTATCAARTRPAGCSCSPATTRAASPPPSRASASARWPATACRCSTPAAPRRSSGSAATGSRCRGRPACGSA